MKTKENTSPLELCQFPRLQAESILDLELYLTAAFAEFLDAHELPLPATSKSASKFLSAQFPMGRDTVLIRGGNFPKFDNEPEITTKLVYHAQIHLEMSKNCPELVQLFKEAFPYIRFKKDKPAKVIRKAPYKVCFECVLYVDEFPGLAKSTKHFFEKKKRLYGDNTSVDVAFTRKLTESLPVADLSLKLAAAKKKLVDLEAEIQRLQGEQNTLADNLMLEAELLVTGTNAKELRNFEERLPRMQSLRWSQLESLTEEMTS